MYSFPYKGAALFTTLFIIICCIYYADFLFMLPYGIHDEAQADRLAVAIQFYDRGMNFFLPRTYHIYATDGITGVEFPVHSYIAALLGHVFGREHISLCFRALTLCVTYAGLLSLYLTCYRYTKDVITALFVPLFLFCSPVYAYYACNYMPDGAAVPLSFIGFYFFSSYQQSSSFHYLVKAIVILTLAALIKTTVGIILLAVMGYTLIDILFFHMLVSKANIRAMLLMYGMSLFALVSYYFYNQYLIKEYNGFIFLLRVLPFDGWKELQLYLNYSLPEVYANEYFVVAQYPMILALLIGGLVLWLRDRKTAAPLPAIILAGVLATSFLFGHQLIHHDYYFLSIWMPFFGIAMVMAIIIIRKVVKDLKQVWLLNGLLLLMLAISFSFGIPRITNRIAVDEKQYPGMKQNLPTNWMQGGSNILHQIGIGKDSTIMVLDETAANVGLLYFDRRGVNAAPGAWRGNIFNVRSYMKDYNIRIMVCNAAKMPEIQTTYAQHFNELFKELYRDERCAIYYLLR